MIRMVEWHGDRLDPDRHLAGLERRLRALGPVSGPVVAAVEADPLLKLWLFLLLPRLKVPFLPLDPVLPAALRERLLSLAGAPLVAEGTPERVRLRAREEPASAARVRHPLPGDVRLLVSTSGSQGAPRLVALTAGNLRASAEASNRLLGLGTGDCWLLCLPLHHVAGISVVERVRLAGASLVLQLPFSPGALLRRLEAGDVTHLSLVPTQLHRLLELDPAFRPPSSLRVVLLGGGPAGPDLVERALELGWPVCPSYGLTEAASQVATLFPPPARWQPGLVGRPLPHLEVKVEGDGRIRIRGESVAVGVLEPAGVRTLVDGEGWFTTGDLGRMDGEGRLRVLGRADEVIVSGGENLHPQLLEEELSCCPGIGAVAVVGVEDPRWGSRAVACYEGPWEVSRVARWAEERLQGPFRPREYRRLKALPRNAMGKILRRELRRRLQEEEG